MKSDDNWKETRLLAEDLQNLIGLPSKVTEDYLKIIEINGLEPLLLQIIYINM